MNAIPAQVAGVDRIAVVTPPRNLEHNPGLAAALVELTLDEVYAVGGAQAVAALAYGTPSIPRVDKIVGPGNRYVAAAKRMVYGTVDIDMIAGPSEVVVVADSAADARWVAADLLAQAEHDVEASAICIALSKALALRIQREVEEQMDALERGAICRRSIDTLGAVIVARSPSQAQMIVNTMAPEHLELHLRRPEPFSRKIRNAGAIFLGAYSPEAVGDYFAGPNHVLPTSGTARFSSPLGVYDFVKRTSIIQYSRERFERDARAIIQLARAEQLTAHARSIESRLKGRTSRIRELDRTTQNET
jgi:histidinol dehydrogenase